MGGAGLRGLRGAGATGAGPKHAKATQLDGLPANQGLADLKQRLVDDLIGLLFGDVLRLGDLGRQGLSLPEPAKRPGEKPDKPPLLLAHSWQNDHDLTGWWMSEKLDGA